MRRALLGLAAAVAVATGCSGSDVADDSGEATTASTTAVETDETTTSTTTTSGSRAGSDAAGSASVELLPNTAVGRATDQLLGAILGETMTAELAEALMTEEFSELIDADTFVLASQQLPPLLGRSPVLIAVQTRTEHHLSGTLLNPEDGSTWSIVAGVEVDPPHRFLTFGVARPEPPTADAALATVDDATAAWAELGSRTQVLVEAIAPASTGAECGSGGEALAIGSAFKFYVLGAVATAVESGEIAWSDEVAVEDRHRSLPSGQLQVEPVGATLTVAEAAELMMGISDNTATDHLIALVGRDAVEAELDVLGNASPALNLPLMTTGELFKLKLGDPIGLGFYGAADEAERRQMLDGLASEPLPEIEDGDFTTPTALDVEWFASAADLCRAIVGLDGRAASQPEIGRALQAGRGLPLGPEEWAAVSFKGGSEPGVLSLTWLVEHTDERRYVVSAIVNDDESGVEGARALSIMARVFELLA